MILSFDMIFYVCVGRKMSVDYNYVITSMLSVDYVLVIHVWV